MLDVHPPHEAAHTWKDFFIHVATICVGLLIAVGLEQSVEWLHHRREIRETRAALKDEFEHNRLNFHSDIAHYRYNAQLLRNNLLVLEFLKAHPGTPEEKLPGALRWSSRVEGVDEPAWKVAQLDGVVALLSREEVAQATMSYLLLAGAETTQKRLWLAINQAQHFAYLDPDTSHLSPAALDHEIALTEDCIDANYQWGVTLLNAAEDDPRLEPSIPRDEIDQDRHNIRSASDQKKLGTATKMTDDRIAAAAAGVQRTLDDIAAHDAAKP